MLRLFSRKNSFRSRARTGFQPRLERLDERAVPAAAVVTYLDGRIIGDNMVVYGNYTDDSPGTDTVFASNGMTGNYVSNNGFFEFVGPYEGNRNVTITILDDEQILSLEYGISLPVPVGNQAPYIMFTVSYGEEKTVTFSGQVTDESPGGLPVSITGAATAGGSLSTNASGWFTVTVTANSLGTVNAKAWDAQALQSNVASLVLVTNKPVITDVVCNQLSPNVFTISGKVTDESAHLLLVQFSGGVIAFQNKQALVQPDGSFSLTVTITDPTDRGLVGLRVTDWWGVQSDLVQVRVI